MTEGEKAAEAKKVADAAKKENEAKPNAAKEETEAQKKEKATLARLKAEGFHNCKMFKVEKGANGVISKLGAKVKDIKAMHESNIDEYNSQQVNSGLFIKKDGVKYELVEVKVPGRKNALKMFMETKKK